MMNLIQSKKHQGEKLSCYHFFLARDRYRYAVIEMSTQSHKFNLQNDTNMKYVGLQQIVFLGNFFGIM